MKKLIFCLLFLMLGIVIYSNEINTTPVAIFEEDWTVEKVREVLMSNEKVSQIDNIEVYDGKILVEGLYIRKIRIDKIYTDTNKKLSSVVILKKDIEESIIRKNDDVKEIEIEIKDGYLIARGEAILLGILHSMYLEGSFYINDQKELYYSLKKAKVKKIIPVPKGILKKFDKKINPFFKLDDLGIPLYLSRLGFEKDKIVVR